MSASHSESCQYYFVVRFAVSCEYTFVFIWLNDYLHTCMYPNTMHRPFPFTTSYAMHCAMDVFPVVFAE